MVELVLNRLLCGRKKERKERKIVKRNERKRDGHREKEKLCFGRKEQIVTMRTCLRPDETIK